MADYYMPVDLIVVIKFLAMETANLSSKILPSKPEGL